MKVLHVIPSLGSGGAERLLANLVAAAEGPDHVVVAMTAEAPFYEFACPVRTLGLARGQSSPGAVARLREIVRQEKPDVVQGWLYHGNFATLFLPRRYRSRLIWSIHNTDLPRGRSKPMTRLIDRACRHLSGLVPRVIVYCAESARRSHEQRGYASRPATVIENGVDMSAFRFDAEARRSLRAGAGIGAEELVVGCVARYDSQKDFPTLVGAFARLRARRGARLLLCGSGCTAENRELAGLLAAADLTADAVLLGPRSDVPAVMSALDVLVVPSSYGEALSIAVLEAASVGAQIVTTDVGSNRALAIDDRLVAPAGESQALAAAMERAAELRNGGEGARLVERRRELVRERFSMEQAARQYAALYREVAGN